MPVSPVELLRTAIGRADAEFRPGQWEAIDALVRRQARLLVVERTGWGKSLVYFLATRLRREMGAGPTLLISPLLSLMRNQILAARNIGIRAETINSSNQDQWPEIESRLRQENFDVLLVSPERLANDGFINRCLLPIANRVGLFVVDEAHCISDWGHDFRPDYQRIVRILQALPRNIPVLATTATANDRVVRDVVRQLGPRLEVFRGALTRASLQLQNIYIPTQAGRLAWVAHRIPQLSGSGIVYTLTVDDAERVAEWLSLCGISAAAYHGRMEPAQREELEDRLLQNQVKALVATVALGMGFDKPDLGFVIHYQRPASVVHYYQQVGRAGRAVENAYGILLNGAEDDTIANYFIKTAFPSPDEVRSVLEILRGSPEPSTVVELQRRVNLSKSRIDKILKFLSLESPSPVQRVDRRFAATPVRWKMPEERIQRITDLRRNEQQRMRHYMASRDCLMQFLSEELNDPHAAPCGKCVNCLGRLLPEAFPEELSRCASEFLDRLEIPIQPKRMWPAGLDSPNMRGRIKPELLAERGRALCRWGDPGWGELVRKGKRESGHFDDQLVEAAVRLILQRWRPTPAPQWLTSVPSRRHATLVPDFARRLARRLDIPFVECVSKVRDTEPQKTRENSFQQARNLGRAFLVRRSLVQPAPVLLVDDMVDSGWTLTVVAAALRHAGAGPVHPFALADASIEDGK
jgi:ATP-dependent DNA helicase RecQ